MAHDIPITPRTISIQNGFCEKPTSRTKMAKVPMPTRKISFRPSRSQSCPTASWNAPAVRVDYGRVSELPDEKEKRE